MYDYMMYYMPFLIIIFRAILGIFILVSIRNKSFAPFFLPAFIIGSGSDLLDGIVCRLYGSSHYPLLLSSLDSYADIIFYLSVIIYLSANYKPAIYKYRVFLVILISLQIVSWIYSLYKFGSLTNYHPYSAKVWGIFIGLTIVEICIRKKSRLILVMILVGILSVFEEMSITYILPVKKSNITSIFKAIPFADEYKLINNRQLKK